MDINSDDLPTTAATRRQALNLDHSSRAVLKGAGTRLRISKMLRLVRVEAINFFDANMENFLSDRITILERTNSLSDTASPDPYVILSPSG